MLRVTLKFGAGERKSLSTKGYGLTSKARFGPFPSKHEPKIAARKKSADKEKKADNLSKIVDSDDDH